MTSNHLKIKHRSTALGDHLSIKGNLGFGDLDLALEVVDLKIAIELLGFNSQLDLLKLGDRIFALNLDVIELNTGCGQALLRRDHSPRERRHYLALGKPIKIFELAGVGGLQLCQPLLIVIKLGQSRIHGGPGSGDTQCIALIERLVLQDQLVEIALLLIKLPFQYR